MLTDVNIRTHDVSALTPMIVGCGGATRRRMWKLRSSWPRRLGGWSNRPGPDIDGEDEVRVRMLDLDLVDAPEPGEPRQRHPEEG
jgi:hypothetical protein